MATSEYIVGRTIRIERSAFGSRDIPYGPSHAVPAGEHTALCGEVVDLLLGPWPPKGLAASPACPGCGPRAT